jgi:hypothetical protein
MMPGISTRAWVTEISPPGHVLIALSPAQLMKDHEDRRTQLQP